MNLIFVSHRKDVSGGEICLQRILEQLEKHQIMVILPEGKFADQLRQVGIKVHIENGLKRMAKSEDPFSIFRLIFRFPGVVFRLARQIREFDADLMVSNALGPLPYTCIAAKLAGAANICIHHHPVLKAGTADAKAVFFLAKLCNGFIAVSKAMERGLQLSGVSPAKIKTIYNGLDVNFYSADRPHSNLLRSTFHLGPEVKIVGLVATIIEAKGHHVVIEAARLLRDKLNVKTPWRVIFVGGVFENGALGNSYKAKLEAQIARDGLQDMVLFAGSQTNMRGVYADMDILLNASIEPEPLGTTIYEAMAMGRLSVASDLGGSREIVDDGRAGFLVPPGDSEKLADLLGRILQNEIDLAPILTAGRARVEQCFDLQNTVRKYSEYFGTFPTARVVPQDKLIRIDVLGL